MKNYLVIFLSLFVLACGSSGDSDDEGTTDAGTTDAGTTDAGTTDAGTTDAGTTDAGTTDAGTTDAGTTDAGTTDAGTTDAGTTDAGTTDAGTTDAGTTDGGTTDGGTTDGGDIVNPPIDGTPTVINLQPPTDTLGAIQPELLTAEVDVDGSVFTLSPNDDFSVWSGDIGIPSDSTAALEASWFYNGVANPDGILVATYNADVGPLAAGTPVDVATADYVTDGIDLDLDQDGDSNLQELIDDVNPFDASNVDVTIPMVPMVTADDGTVSTPLPGINGESGSIWTDNPLSDWRGNRLNIDNLMINAGATRADNDTEFFWQALHDGTWLYLIAFGENLVANVDVDARGDSNDANRDDTLNIFIDGDNSKGETYDGVNDFDIRIPLAQLRTTSDPADGPAVADANGDLIFDDNGNIGTGDAAGPSFVPAADLQYNDNRDDNAIPRVSFGGTGLQISSTQTDEVPQELLRFSTGAPPTFPGDIPQVGDFQQVYEIRINLEESGILLGQPFGIDLQLDVDDDGGDRDARFGWAHPSMEPDGEDVNGTVTNPSLMGTAILSF